MNINGKIHTKLAKGYTGLGAPKVKRETTYCDPDDLQICDDPLPKVRVNPINKYWSKFDQLKVGQGLRCLEKDVSKVACAMRKWIESKKKHGTTCKTCARYDGDVVDGVYYGRVWWVKA